MLSSHTRTNTRAAFLKRENKTVLRSKSRRAAYFSRVYLPSANDLEYDRVMIFSQSCLRFIGIAGAPALNVSRTGSNSCLRAIRRKCARISLPAFEVSSREICLLSLIRYSFSSYCLSPVFLPLFHFTSDFTRAPIDHIPHLRNFTPNHVHSRGIFRTRRIVLASNVRTIVHGNLIALHYFVVCAPHALPQQSCKIL